MIAKAQKTSNDIFACWTFVRWAHVKDPKVPVTHGDLRALSFVPFPFDDVHT